MSDSGDCGGHHSADCGHHGHGSSHGGGNIFVHSEEYSSGSAAGKPQSKTHALTYVAIIGLAVGAVLLYRDFKKRHEDKIPETQQR